MNSLILKNYALIFLLLSLLSLFIFTIFKDLTENKKKYLIPPLVYIFCGGLSLFVYIIKESKNLFNNIILKYNIQSVLRDPQQILEVLFNFSMWIVLIYTFFNILFLIYILSTNILKNIETKFFKNILFLMFYYFFVFYIISIYDLLTFHIEIFSKQNIFKYEPDIEKWYFYAEFEALDLILYLIFLNIFYNLNWYKNIFFHLKKINIIRIIIYTYLYLFTIMFIGGDSLIHDFIIIITSFLSIEFYIFSHIYFYKIKKIK